jgi:hypothetical protein
MAEPGRVPPLLRLCRGCRQFVRINEEACPFCGGDLDLLQADYEQRVADMHQAAAELREAMAHADLTNGDGGAAADGKISQ